MFSSNQIRSAVVCAGLAGVLALAPAPALAAELSVADTALTPPSVELVATEADAAAAPEVPEADTVAVPEVDTTEVPETSGVDEAAAPEVDTAEVPEVEAPEGEVEPADGIENPETSDAKTPEASEVVEPVPSEAEATEDTEAEDEAPADDTQASESGETDEPAETEPAESLTLTKTQTTIKKLTATLTKEGSTDGVPFWYSDRNVVLLRTDLKTSSPSVAGWRKGSDGAWRHWSHNHGPLAIDTGWLVTADGIGGYYGQQRYWLNSDGSCPFNKVIDFGGGKRSYATAHGYVARGLYVISTYYAKANGGDGNNYHDDTIAYANNDGYLLTLSQVRDLLVKAAKSQLGTRYSYVDSGWFPNDSFNCSGLSWYVYYRALGVNLSHNQGYYSYYSVQNNKENSQVYEILKRNGWKSTSQLQPGDLVFFSPMGDKYHTGHVGVYIGNGKMIDSYPGIGTTIRSVWQSGVVGGGFPLTLV